jgi:hypothetical protein
MESRLNPQEARDALAAVEQSRSDIADRLYTPWWYHPILGILVGALIAVAGFTFNPVYTGGALVAFSIGVFLLVLIYRRKAGVWADGTAGPRARRQAIIAGVVGGILALSSYALVLVVGTWWPAVTIGALLAVLTGVWGRHFDKVLRADLRGTA